MKKTRILSLLIALLMLCGTVTLFTSCGSVEDGVVTLSGDEVTVDLTGYSYESWHYRFVGRDAATEMYFADQCLEEYLESQGN